ncbi:alkane 1-monooxygenase, partial [Nocardia farcinica]|nr:alkane 1-monooxygenase [Nocardia farcinica]
MSPWHAASGTDSRGDPKRHLWVLGLIAPASALLPSQLVLRTGWEVFWWVGPIIVLV